MQLDSQLVNHIFNYTNAFLLLYCILLAGILLIYLLKKKKTKIIVKTPIRVIFMFALFYFIQSIRSGSNYYEIIMSWITLLTITLQYLVIVNYRSEISFLWISYITPILFLMGECKNLQINFINELSNVNFSSLLFGSDRYRADFGFYNINITGNICACILLVSFILLWYAKQIDNKLKRKIVYFILVIGDIFTTLLLILADSRNAMFTVLISIVVIAFLFVTNSDRLILNQRRILQGLLLFAGVLLIIAFIVPGIMENAISSGRSFAANTNIKVLDTLPKQLFGIGLVGSGAFGRGEITGYYTVALDNYFMYILIASGIIGLIWIVSALIRIGVDLFKKIELSKLYIVIFGIFIGHVASGIGETCILYYSFLSSIIYFIIYFTYTNYDEAYIEEQSFSQTIN